ncbi:c-type cytochrome [Phaeobacter gallaeciensis]|uniref:c-type cytochrome n=1 Tax=Phaeobacter gallaeciensis TaxID=60890 RepID=UPI00237F566A|nr:c-type cytochrome [Phaeobacter gallaeciensis]MDE4191174.1 c-type cytochrome [Phaeobacter gallaeciensis]MDE4199639.1 c-type cytochrome [Phaeobacter gallaeciensis]MDE4203787.1 c-type cytochrome [Phaeobacter gallaeciensis]MDE4207929.1 c-type cytochrome [Phaeobacter gallaeciensis]MDE4216296.1 c-type cytochrome [Phaeobacter gallaeciensis]
MKTKTILCMLPLVAGLAVACTEIVNSMPTAQEGQILFNQNCALCHGENGDIAQRETTLDAPDLRKINARHDGAFPRAAVLSQIDGYGRGKVSAEYMPEFGALLEGELIPVEVEGTLTPTPRPLAALMTYLESIQAEG